MKEFKKKSSQTVKVTESKKASDKGYDFLEPLEEKVLRMRYGLSEDESKEIEYFVGAAEDAKLRISLMEANNVSHCGGRCPLAEGKDPAVLLEIAEGIES